MQEPITKKMLAPRPPLGWNSYDSYRCRINEDDARRNLEIFAKTLKPHGYEYFVLDAGWYDEHVCVPGTLRAVADTPFDKTLNEYGLPVASKTLFPHGIKALADRAHELGVKFGLHLMRGVYRKAWQYNLPIKNTPYRTRDIADPEDVCSWSDQMYGVDMSKPGAQEYYDALIEHVAQMGVDYIKFDDLVPFPAEVESVGKAVAKCKRDIVLSLSPGDDTTVTDTGHYKWGHVFRITGDVWDWRGSLESGFKRWREWQGKAEPGFWPDMDMLCLGTLVRTIDPGPNKREAFTPEEIAELGDDAFFRRCHLSPAQERTFLTMRAMAASPLFMGGCLIRTEPRVIDLITHPDMLACNQNGVSGTLQYEDGPIEIWRTPRKTGGGGWIGIFNRDHQRNASVALTSPGIGLHPDDCRFRDIWADHALDPGQVVDVAPDDVVFVEYVVP